MKYLNLPLGLSFWGLELKVAGEITISHKSSAIDTKDPSFPHFGYP